MTTRPRFAAVRLGILVPVDAPSRMAVRIRDARPYASDAARNAAYQDRVTRMLAGWTAATAR